MKKFFVLFGLFGLFSAVAGSCALGMQPQWGDVPQSGYNIHQATAVDAQGFPISGNYYDCISTQEAIRLGLVKESGNYRPGRGCIALTTYHSPLPNAYCNIPLIGALFNHDSITHRSWLSCGSVSINKATGKEALRDKTKQVNSFASNPTIVIRHSYQPIWKN